MNSRMTDFRKRDVKEVHLNSEKQQTNINQLFRLILGLTNRLFQLEQKLLPLLPVAKAADWRSLAIMKMLSETVDSNGNVLITEDAISNKIESLETEFFDKENLLDDQKRGLLIADEDVAADGHFVIATINIFKDGKELPEERVVRTKLELGAHELFPELDDAIRGMKVGEIKKFPLDLQGRTDTAELKLLGLRNPKPKEEPQNAPDSPEQT